MKIKKEVGEKILRCSQRIAALYQHHRAIGASETASSVAAMIQGIREYELTDEEKEILFKFLEHNSRQCRIESNQNN
jgi:hypothetical protein